MSDPAPQIVIAPFANERIREWPPEHFRRLIALLLEDPEARIAVVGTLAQRARANDIVRAFPSTRVENTCGRLSWDDLLGLIDAAPFVVANNSGVAHLAAKRGRWTLCLFSGSHAFVEWSPRGPRVVVCSLDIPCSPCGLGGDKCPNGHACMVELKPETVLAQFEAARMAQCSLA
jgi:ADP-heptose:LPS heptosyltransferase